MGKRIFLLLALLAAGCFTPAAPPSEWLYEVEGSSQLMPKSAAYAAELAAVHDRAAREMSCADVAIDRGDFPEGSGDEGGRNVFRARGCGKQRLYVRYVRPQFRPPAPLFYRVDFIDLARFDPATVPADQQLRQLRALLALSVQAARDLQCSQDEIVPQLRNLGHDVFVPLAVGCGHRATYVAQYGVGHGVAPLHFDLAGLVDVPGAPAFVSWPPSDLQ
jgi:hypothetical protein